MTKRKTRISYRQRQARKQAWQIAALCVGMITVVIPATIVFGVIFGTTLSKNDAAFRAIVNLF